MRSFKINAVLIVLCATGMFLFTGCRSKYMAKIQDTPFYGVPADAQLSQTTEAIMEVGKRRSVPMTLVQPGEIEAVLIGRNRVSRATVLIKYDVQRFSIIYKDSTELMYNPKNNKINHNYNNWVLRLEKDLANAYLRK